MNERQQLRFALGALAAGLAWGYLRHRGGRHPFTHAVLQGVEWFVAYGGAVALISGLRERLQDVEPEIEERITHFRQVITDHTGTDG
ncbi:MAG: hypothetical protein AB7I38_07885 [Dehalococcoidia bacterium]